MRLRLSGIPRFVLTLTATITGLLVVAPAVMASWTPPEQLTSGAASGSVLTAAGVDGTAAVVWAESGGIVATVKPPGADFGETVQVGAGSKPQAAVDDEGRVVLAWMAGDDVKFAERPADGTFSAPATVIHVPGLSHLSLAINDAGRVLLAYASPSRRGLITRPRSAPGFSAAWNIDQPAIHTGLSVAGGPDGDGAWVGWTDRDGYAVQTSRVLGRRWIDGIGAGPEQLIEYKTDLYPEGGIEQKFSFDGVKVVGGDHATILYRREVSDFASVTQTVLATTAVDGSFGAKQTLASGFSSSFSLSGETVEAPMAVETSDGGAVFASRTSKSSFLEIDGVWGVVSAKREGAEFMDQEILVPRTLPWIDALQIGALPGDRVSAVYGGDRKVLAAIRSRAGSPEGETNTIAGDDGNVVARDISIAGDRQGGLAAAWADPSGRMWMAEYDEGMPDASITGPENAVVGQAVTFSSGKDRWSPVTTAWWTGDGETAAGHSIGHTYERPGTYLLTATVTDGAGNASTETKTIEVTAVPDPDPDPDPGPDPDPDPVPDTTAPALENIKLSATRFSVAKNLTGITPRKGRKAARGTKVSFTLTEPATVTISISRSAKGKRKTLANMPSERPAGAGSIPFTGRLKGKALKPGRYRLTLAAKDVAGNASTPVHKAFVIVRG